MPAKEIDYNDLRAVVYEQTVYFYHQETLLASDPINDGDVSLMWFGSSPFVDAMVVATIHGTQSDLSYGYAIQNGAVYRSQMWRDLEPGWLYLNIGPKLVFQDWANYTLDSRGVMSYDDQTQTWTSTAGDSARLDNTTGRLPTPQELNETNGGGGGGGTGNRSLGGQMR